MRIAEPNRNLRAFKTLRLSKDINTNLMAALQMLLEIKTVPVADFALEQLLSPGYRVSSIASSHQLKRIILT